MKLKGISLAELEVESFVTSLNTQENSIVGGATTTYTGPTSKCNPGTDESTVSTCACGQTDCQTACINR
jgi:hypothetical protein